MTELAPTEKLPDPKPLQVLSDQKTKKKPRFSKWKKGLLIFVFALSVSVGWFGYKVYATWQAIGVKNAGDGAPALSGLDSNQLRGEGDGRVNVLVLGRDKVAGLTDTVIVASIDPETGHVAMLSIPRDFYIPVKGANVSMKINAVFGYGDKQKVPGGGAQLLKDSVSNVIDFPIHYFVTLDFEGFRRIIDTVGGIDVVNEKHLQDYSYPNDNYSGFDPFILKAGPQHLDGKLALKYARCRKGTCGNDFGRARRQQEVVTAVGNKVRSSETLLNPKKISEIIKTLGNHVRTDLELWEIEKLIEIGRRTDIGKITSVVLTNEANHESSLLVAGSSSAGYILKPKSGNFDEIRAYVHSIFVDPYLVKEGAKLEIQNASVRTGLAAQVGKLLTTYNYKVVKTVNLDRRDQQDNVIITYGDAKERLPYTLRLLSLRFKVNPGDIKVESTPPESGADIVVILGNNYGK